MSDTNYETIRDVPLTAEDEKMMLFTGFAVRDPDGALRLTEMGSQWVSEWCQKRISLMTAEMFIGHVFYDLNKGDYFKVIQEAADEPGLLEIADGDYAEDVRNATEHSDTWISVQSLRDRIKDRTIELI